MSPSLKLVLSTTIASSLVTMILTYLVFGKTKEISEMAELLVEITESQASQSSPKKSYHIDPAKLPYISTKTLILGAVATNLMVSLMTLCFQCWDTFVTRPVQGKIRRFNESVQDARQLEQVEIMMGKPKTYL